MIRILIDTNIILDVLFDRQPFVEDAVKLWQLVEAERVIGCLTATTLTNIFYIARKQLGPERTREVIADLLAVFEVWPVGKEILSDALSLPFTDYEDAVQEAVAQQAGADAIITRNLADYTRSTFRVMTAGDIIRELETGVEATDK
ncbi:TPA: PIN domain-containing protein [Candidatus Poribacteria bacterium]|nr:PIN domain-containing protein [Candidatus Poribacteria bacterium]